MMFNFVLPVLASALWLSVTLTDGVSVCDIDSVSSFPVTLETPDHSRSAGNASDSRCMVRVAARKMVRLRILSFSLGGQEPCSDHLEHLDLVFSPLSVFGRGTTDIQRWCGRSYGPMLETQALEWLVYYSGPPGKRGAGFNITLDVVSSYSCGSDISPITVQDEPIYIFSPGFPDQYPVLSMDCQWIIQSANGNRLLLDTVRFAVEKHAQCSYDYLTINEVRYCGFDRVRAQSRSNSFDLQFKFDFNSPMEGFMLKVVQIAAGPNFSCRQIITVGTSPVLLQMPLLEPGRVNNLKCLWKVDSGSDNRVVLMDVEEYVVTADCIDFVFKLYDGATPMDSVLTSGCGPMQSFQMVRSSSRFLLLEADLTGFGRHTINVTFSLLSSPIDAAPRVLNAGTAESFIFLNMSHSQDLGILVQGSNHDPNNYSHCLHLQVKRSPQASVLSLAVGNFFMVFSGWNESFSELTTSCGREDVYRVISRGSKIFLTYKKGIFDPVWLIYSLKQDCEVDVLELQSQMTISRTIVSDRSYESVPHSSPPFPLQLSTSYPNNAYCRWVLMPASSRQFTQVRGEKTNLFRDSCHDNLTVFDWQQGRPTKLLTWCDGSEPQLISSPGNNLLLVFVSDSRYNTGNFSIAYFSVSLLSECPSMVLLTAQTTVQVLTSPNYPNNYPNNVDCQWRIVSPAGFTVKLWVNVSISRDMRQCSNADFLVIYDGSDSSSRVLADLCGTVISRYNSSTRNVLVNFHSDSSVSDRGFLLQYSTQKQLYNYPCGSELQVTESQDAFITSPFYPDDYESYTDCYWVVSAIAPQVIVLEVMNLDLPCVDGSVALFDGRTSEGRMVGQVCNSQNQQQYSSSQSALYLHFRAMNEARHSGFRFRLRSKTMCGGEVYHLTAYTTTNYFTSPLYPEDYPPNSDCVWRIQAVYSNMTVRLDVDDIRLESTFTCNYDYVSVSDGYSTASQNLGQFCGEHKETFLSSGEYLLVHFVSDSLKQFRGFRMAYTAVSSPSYNKAGSGSNSMVGAVVGGVLGGIIFLLLGITAIICSLVRRGRLSRHPRSAPPPPPPQREQSGNTVFVMSPVIVNTSSLPPPYPGITNPGFTCDEVPPPPFYSLRLSAPPQYEDLEAPPPYTENMMMSHPPSPSRLNSDSTQAKDGFFAGNHKFGEVGSPPLLTGLVSGQPTGFQAQEVQRTASAAPSTITSSASAPIPCELSASESLLQPSAPDPTLDSNSATNMAATFV